MPTKSILTAVVLAAILPATSFAMNDEEISNNALNDPCESYKRLALKTGSDHWKQKYRQCKARHQ